MSESSARVTVEVSIPLPLWQAWLTGTQASHVVAEEVLAAHGCIPPAAQQWPSTFRCRLDAGTQAYVVTFDMRVAFPAKI